MAELLSAYGLAFFLAVMAGMNAWNMWLLWRSKEVKGLSPITVLVRSGANVWQAWFFCAHNQWLLFWCAALATSLNFAWVVQALCYQARKSASDNSYHAPTMVLLAETRA